MVATRKGQVCYNDILSVIKKKKVKCPFQIALGLTVGEEVEAVNSYLSRVATTTKYMSKASE